MDSEYFNIAQLLTETARQYPDKEALFSPVGKLRNGNFKYSTLTFSQLENLTNAYAQSFNAAGIVKGIRTLMFLRPGLEFAAAVFAVYKTGGIPVLIDPGMGFKNLLGCIRQTESEAMIAISPVHWIRLACPNSFNHTEIFFSLGKFPPPGVKKLEKIVKIEEIQKSRQFDFTPASTTLDDNAAIVFTTGSTGPPKGVVYTHRTFQTQINLIRDVYGAGPEHIDLSAFPLFALFAVILGMPSIIPKMDFTRPAKVNPENIIKPILDKKISFSFGSPALWKTVSSYCIKNNIRLTSLKRVLMAGAPVPASLHRQVKKIIADDGETMVPYGATEAMPITNMTGNEVLNETEALTLQGKGHCVGYPNPGIKIAVIKSSDAPISKWRNELVLANEDIGEIVVKGNVVKKEYFKQQRHNAVSTIPDEDGKSWHRLGDLGYFDTKGRLWFCGRKNHAVITTDITYYSVCVEAIFNQHPQVNRSALVGIDNVPIIYIEPLNGHWPHTQQQKDQFINELREVGKRQPFTANIDTFLFHRSFPVDIRHNAKIFREKLASMAGKMMAKKS